MSAYPIHLNMFIILLLTVSIHFLLVTIDVSELLFPKVYSCDYIQSIDSFVTSISLPPWTCNEISYTVFDFSRFSSIVSIDIRDNSFSFVETFRIDGLNRLRSLKIGEYSFTKYKQTYPESDASKSFHILNCESLVSINIGIYSFNEFGGIFELKNLTRLQSIQIGTYGSDSWNFYHASSFEINGTDMKLPI